MAEESDDAAAEEMFDRAVALAERHLAAARAEAGPVADFVAIAMIEAATNAAVETMTGEEVASLLRDLAEQIEDDVDGGPDED